MAATETKVIEVKEVEEQIEPILCKTYALKVSIHCEGCKRKVNKILQSIDGVYSVNIDLKKQKVVVTGNVDIKLLIKKLTKAGRHAEIWPEKPDSKKKKQGKSDKQNEAEGREDSSQASDEDEKEDIKVIVQGAPKNCEASGFATGKTGVQFQEPKAELKQVVTVSSGNQPSGNEGGGGTKKKKKKKKKGQKSNNTGAEGGERSGDAPGNLAQVQVVEAISGIPIPTNQYLPGHHHVGHQYPPHYAPPVSTVRHHAANPSNSYSTAYYSSRDDNELYTLQPLCSFEFLSDENPNACALM